MIRFKNLLVENPDTLVYKSNRYNYTRSCARSAFFVYNDIIDTQIYLFGYSDIKKEFFCTNPEVLKQINELTNNDDIKYDSDKDDSSDDGQIDYWAKNAIEILKLGNSGGGHQRLYTILKGIGRIRRGQTYISSARLFEVDDDTDKKMICSFWETKNTVLKYMNFWEDAIKFNGFDPKEILYEPSKFFYTYSQLMDINYDASKQTTVVPVKDSTLQKVIDDKTNEYVDKRGKLHTTGATLTPEEKNSLNLEVFSLDTEIKILTDIKKSGITDYNTPGLQQSVKSVVDRAVAQYEHDKTKRYNLGAETEKQFGGMPMAQIRSLYRGIPLGKLIKKESLYKKLMRHMKLL